MTQATMKKPKLTKIQKIELQISDAQASSQDYQEKIKSLRTEHAKLTVKGSTSLKTKESLRIVDKRIFNLQKLLDNAPAELALLRENLKNELALISKAKRDKLLVEQKELAKQIVSLSELLVDDLKLAVKSNEKLDVVYSRYVGLQKLTGENILDNCHCEPSRGMLRYIFQTLSAELLGKHQRIMLPPPAPQI